MALEREYKAEVKHSQNLQASRSGTAPAAGVVGGITPEEAAKDAACLRLYEDLSDLSVPNVKIRDTGKAGKEIVYNCIQTYAGRSELILLPCLSASDLTSRPQLQDQDVQRVGRREG